jgi:hypothetical protein
MKKKKKKKKKNNDQQIILIISSQYTHTKKTIHKINKKREYIIL